MMKNLVIAFAAAVGLCAAAATQARADLPTAVTDANKAGNHFTTAANYAHDSAGWAFTMSDYTAMNKAANHFNNAATQAHDAAGYYANGDWSDGDTALEAAATLYHQGMTLLNSAGNGTNEQAQQFYDDQDTAATYAGQAYTLVGKAFQQAGG
ncbi:MAG TPA: hypothetical protein VFW33_13880 [Gemmataceae bacterium]|nr:hypothetical protein [Gemmataceae bacterium]